MTRDAWKLFEETAAAACDDAAAERERGMVLADEFRVRGALRMTPSRALKDISDVAVAVFYRELARDGRLQPARDPSWMLEADYAFVNVRACGPDPASTGRVTDALKIIPCMRVSAIHLAPFFDNTLHNLYAVDSVRVVSDAVLDHALLAAGLDGDSQIRMLVDGIHILGWRVGFDLEPHTSNFSRIALENPHCFRWLRIAADRSGLFGGVTQEEMLLPDAQNALVLEVREIVASACASHGLDAVEDLSKGVEVVRRCHDKLVQKLIAEGYWTLPSHTWSGVGLPKFDHYKIDENYPEYEYLDVKGEDQHEHAFGMLSPYKLYDPLPLNEEPLLESPPQPVPESVALLNGIFPDVQARYGFDFVRLDYVDHVFDSTSNGSWDIPVSDRMTPQALENLLAAARVRRPETGAMAERMGVDVEDYGALGFNLLLGTDVLTTMHADYVNFLFSLQRELDDDEQKAARELTRQWKPATVSLEAAAPVSQPVPGSAAAHVANKVHAHCSVLAAIDTHDSGHPLFWTVPLSEAVGADGLHLRHFLARFATCGTRRRPKYEVMGNQDLSHGLYDANNHPVSLQWRDDAAFNRRYHGLEDVYHAWRPFLRAAKLGMSYVDREDSWAAWFLDGDGERLLCVAALEPAVEKVKHWLAEPPELEPTGRITVDVVVGTSWTAAQVSEIALDGGAASEVALQGNMLMLDSIERQSCRLYRVRRA